MSVQVRLARPDEAPLVREIMLAAFAEHERVLQPPSGAHLETVEDVRRAMAEGGAVLAWLDGVAAGSARFRPYPDYLYVGRVSVLPGYRRLGIASAMMVFLEDEARRRALPRVQLAVRLSLPSNLALYTRLGYRTLSVEPHPRGPDQVATMAKPTSRSASESQRA